MTTATPTTIPHPAREQLDNLIKPLLSLGSGESRSVRVDLKNYSSQTQSGNVAISLPAGFSADAATRSYGSIPAGGTGAVTFGVTNTDASEQSHTMACAISSGVPRRPTGDMRPMPLSEASSPPTNASNCSP